MTDRESELIKRIVDGDMSAYDELCPNATPEDKQAIIDFRNALKEVPPEKMWLVVLMYILSVAFNRNEKMKLQELLKERERLREIDAQLRQYDELKHAVEELTKVYNDNGEPYDCKSHPYQLHITARNGNRSWGTFTMQPQTLQAIIQALQSEIDKLEKEQDMPLFICAKCGCVENTALSTYWFRKGLKYTDGLEEYQDKPLCSECGMVAFRDDCKDYSFLVPGRWHNQFPKVQATEEQRRNMREDGRFE